MKHLNITIKLLGTDSDPRMIIANTVRQLRRQRVSQEIIDGFLEEAFNTNGSRMLETVIRWFDVE
jgi:hypothetical protein